MVLTETSNKAAAAGGLSIDRTRFRFLGAAYFLTRPIVMGFLVLLFSILCCRAHGESPSTSYQMPRYAQSTPVLAEATSRPSKAAQKSDTDAVPLLLLSFIGLAGMAISRTRTSTENRN